MLYLIKNDKEEAMHEEYDGYETVKQRLIIAGLAELQAHGTHDFSLRRVATACNVSCAAPYKHFKDKETFIAEIFKYIHLRWEMLHNQIKSVFDGNERKQIVESCISYIRFWIANPHFRSVLMMNNQIESESNMRESVNQSLNKLLTAHFTNLGYTEELQKRKIFIIRSLVYGALLMLEDNELENCEQTIGMIRSCIEEQV